MANSFSKMITRILKEDGTISNNIIKEGPEYIKRYETCRRKYDKRLCMYGSITLAIYGAYLTLMREPCLSKPIAYDFHKYEELYRKFKKYVKPIVRIKVGDVIKMPKYALLSRNRAKETKTPIYVTVVSISESSMNVKVSYESLSRRRKSSYSEEKTERWIPMSKFSSKLISYDFKN